MVYNWYIINDVHPTLLLLGTYTAEQISIVSLIVRDFQKLGNAHPFT